MEPWIKLNHRQFGGRVCWQSSWWSCWVAVELFIETSLYFCKNFQVLAKICLSFHAIVLAMSKNQLWGVNETSPCSQILLHRTEADIVLCLQRQLCARKGMKGPTAIVQLSFLQSYMSMTQLAGWRAHLFPMLYICTWISSSTESLIPDLKVRSSSVLGST